MIRCILKSLALVAALSGAVQAAVSEVGRSAVEAARSYGAAVRSCDMGWAFDFMYPPLKSTYAEQYSNRNGKEAENARRIMHISGTEETVAQQRARREANVRALRDYYVKMGEQIKKSGVKIEAYNVREPVSEYVLTPPRGVVNAVYRDAKGQVNADQLQGETERSRLVVLPVTLTVAVVDPHTADVRRIERRSHIYAIRDEVVSGPVDARGVTRRGTKINQWYFLDGNTDTSILRTFFPNLPPRLRLPDSGERVLR